MCQKLERNNKCFCGSGIKYKKCHYHINSESKIAELYVYRDKFNKSVKELKLLNLCKCNCNECCKDYFYITENEFLLILDYLISKNKNIDNYIAMAKEVYNDISLKHSDIICKLDENANRMGNFEYYFDDRENYSDLPNCIFLKNGLCEIYEVRPDVCRAYGTTISCNKINNQFIDIKEMYEMFVVSQMLQGDNKIINIRPYPMFYWFEYFLGNETMKLKTMNKLNVILKKSKNEYGGLYEILNT